METDIEKLKAENARLRDALVYACRTACGICTLFRRGVCIDGCSVKGVREIAEEK